MNEYTKLGSSAPAIQVRTLTGTSPIADGGSLVIPHGLAFSQILSITVFVRWSGGNINVQPNTPSVQGFAGYQYRFYYNNSDVGIELTSGNSFNILNSPILIFITYQP